MRSTHSASHAAHLRVAIVLGLLLTLLPGTLAAQKTDSVVVRNGNRMLGEIKGLKRGQLQFSTDAMSTVYVEWPKVVTVMTDKTFEVELSDGRLLWGSLAMGTRDSVVIVTDSTLTTTVATQRVVSLNRLKASFWDALDGSVNLGFDFTQQNAKTDINLNGSVQYAHRSKPGSADAVVHLSGIRKGFALTKLSYNYSFSRQDSTADISRYQTTLSHLRLLKNRWFWTLALTGEKNSQLSLDYRGTIAATAGYFLVQSNKMDLGVMAGPGYSREQYSGEASDSAVPFILGADLEYFTWGALDTNISSQLGVIPILDDRGRWRISFNLTVSREVINNVYINLGVTESYDSKPTAADANKNDFSLTTSLGWSF